MSHPTAQASGTTIFPKLFWLPAQVLETKRPRHVSHDERAAHDVMRNVSVCLCLCVWDARKESQWGILAPVCPTQSCRGKEETKKKPRKMEIGPAACYMHNVHLPMCVRVHNSNMVRRCNSCDSVPFMKRRQKIKILNTFACTSIYRFWGGKKCTFLSR